MLTVLTFLDYRLTNKVILASEKIEKTPNNSK